MGWSAEHMTCWEVPRVGKWTQPQELRVPCLSIRVISPSLEGDIWREALLAPQLVQGTGEGEKTSRGSERGHREYRSKGGSSGSSGVAGWVRAACFSASFKGPQGTPRPTADPKAPLLPSTAKGPGSHLDTWGERGVAQGRVKEAVELMTMTGSTF